MRTKMNTIVADYLDTIANDPQLIKTSDDYIGFINICPQETISIAAAMELAYRGGYYSHELIKRNLYIEGGSYYEELIIHTRNKPDDYDVLLKWLNKCGYVINEKGNLDMDNGERLNITRNKNESSEPYVFKIIDSKNNTRYHKSVEYVKALIISTGCEGEITLDDMKL